MYKVLQRDLKRCSTLAAKFQPSSRTISEQPCRQIQPSCVHKRSLNKLSTATPLKGESQTTFIKGRTKTNNNAPPGEDCSNSSPNFRLPERTHTGQPTNNIRKVNKILMGKNTKSTNSKLSTVSSIKLKEQCGRQMNATSLPELLKPLSTSTQNPFTQNSNTLQPITNDTMTKLLKLQPAVLKTATKANTTHTKRQFSSEDSNLDIMSTEDKVAKYSKLLQPKLLKANANIMSQTRRLFSSASSTLKIISTREAVAHIKPNSVVFVEGVVGTPKVLMNAMYDHVKGNNIQGVTILDVFSLYPYDNMTLEDECVRRLTFFVSPFTRKYVNSGKAEYIPLMLNDLPLVFDRRYFTPDVALISVSPPDSAGYVSLGTNVTELLSVLAASKLVIAQINDKMPRTLGDALIHVNQIDYAVEVSYELFSPAPEQMTDLDKTIANLICAELIEDEATLQIGIGKIPEAILSQIKHHKNLGVHTELLTPGILPLLEDGIINNSRKSIDAGIMTATLLLGNKNLYDFTHENEMVQMKPCSYSNDSAIIRKNHRMTAINTCLEIDLTGQVVSDSLGTTIYSGFGGQVDFMRGAMTGLDGRGKAILALPSQDETSGESKIVSRLKPGAGVVCTRAHVNWIVTEYGLVDLCGKSREQRAHALIQLAHPQHRDKLEREAFELLRVMPRA